MLGRGRNLSSEISACRRDKGYQTHSQRLQPSVTVLLGTGYVEHLVLAAPTNHGTRGVNILVSYFACPRGLRFS